jgi:hypothetical protein
MPGGSNSLAYKEVQGVVIRRNGIRWLKPIIDHIFVRLGFQEAYGHPDAFPHALLVVGVLEIAVVKSWLHRGIGRGQADVPGAVGQAEGARDSRYAVGGNVTIYSPGQMN